MKFNDILKKRHCSRHFKSKDIGEKDLSEILDSARFSPCAGGIFAIKLIVVDDKSKKGKIAEACLGQKFVAEAPQIIVVCSDMEPITKSYGSLAGMFARQQAGAAIENIFLKTTELGLGTCWIGAFDENPIRRALHLPDKFKVEAILPLGYEQGKSLIKEKIDLRRIVRFNEWSEKSQPEKGYFPTATSNE